MCTHVYNKFWPCRHVVLAPILLIGLACPLIRTAIAEEAQAVDLEDSDSVDASPAELFMSHKLLRRNVDALGDPLPPGALLRLGSLRFRHPSTVAGMALSPDEKTIATIGDELIVWDAATGKERWRANMNKLRVRLPAASYGIQALAFTPDSTRLYTPGQQDQVLIWDVQTGRSEVFDVERGPQAARPQFGQFGTMIKFIDVAPDGLKLALGNDRGVVVYDKAGKTLFEVVNKPTKPLDPDEMSRDRLVFGGDYASGQFSPDGKITAVVLSEAPEEIQLLDAETGNELRRLVLNAKLVRLAFSPDGATITATERDNAVRLYEVATGNRVWSHVMKLTNPYENYTSAIAFAPDGRSIAVCATDNRIHLLEATTGDETASLAGHNWYPWHLASTADGKMLYSAGWDGPVRRWDIATREQIGLPEGVRATGVVGISPDGKRLAYEDDSGAIRLVDAVTGSELRTFDLPGTQYSQLKFSPDGGQLAGGGTSGDQVHVAVWDLSSGELAHRWNWAKGRDPHSDIKALCFSPDGQRLAVAVFRQSTVYWWDLKSNQQTAKRKHGEVYGLSFRPDGRTLATVGWDSIVRLWEANTGTLRQEISLKNDEKNGIDLRMYSVCYAPHGELVATQHMNGQVWLWDAATMKVRTKIEAGDNFGAMSFSPDGLWLVTGTRGGSISLWEALTGQKVLDVGTHQDSVDTLSFGRGSSVLVSGGGDGVCYLWDMRPLAHSPAKDLIGLWDDLSGDSAYAVYRAMWAISADPDRAAPFLAAKLRGVTKLMDPDEVEEGISKEEAKRRRRLKRLLIEREPALERRLTAQRAISLLANFKSPLAKQLLKELGTQDPDGEVGALAVAALGGREGLEQE